MNYDHHRIGVNPRRCECGTPLQAIPMPESKHTIPCLHCMNCDLLRAQVDHSIVVPDLTEVPPWF